MLRLMKKEKSGWKRERLLAVKLGLEGEWNLEEIARAVGRTRTQVQIWFDPFRAGGLAALLHRGRGKGPQSLLRPLIAGEMRRKLRRGRLAARLGGAAPAGRKARGEGEAGDSL